MGGAAFALGIASIVDAARFCEPRGDAPKGAVIAAGVGFYFVVPVLVTIVLRVFVLEAFKVPSGAMMPTVLVGDHVFADKAVFRRREPRRGEVMVFAFPEHPEQDFLKRVVAVGGDRIVVKNGHPVINGWEVPSCAAGKWSYTESADDGGARHVGDLFVEFLDGAAYLTLYDRDQLGAELQGPWLVEPGHYFVMGDNRNNSHDSRTWFGGAGGTVPRTLVRGEPRWVWLATDPTRSGIDVGGAEPALPSGVERAAVEACLAARPPRDKTVPPPR
jgi:signal peptidase I